MDDIIYGISTLKDGNMKIATKAETKVLSNRRIFLEKKNLDISGLVSVVAEHKNKVFVVKDRGNANIDNCDALVTDRKNIILGVTVADCLPVYFFDQNRMVIGIAHAGWRGLLAGVLENTIIKMKDTFNTDPKDIRVLIGPHIKSDSYEIGPDIAEKFKIFKEALLLNENKYYLDLSKVSSEILKAQGICYKNIGISPIDTFKDENYFSYRRDNPSEVKAMLAYIKLKNYD